MAGTWALERFPQFEDRIRRLTQEHRELKGEPLHLAISYVPGHDTQDIFLLEVIGGSGVESVSPDRELFETVFVPTPGFATGFDEPLHLVLTNREELEVALDENWPSAREIADAIGRGDCKVLHTDDIGRQVWERIERHNQGTEAVARE